MKVMIQQATSVDVTTVIRGSHAANNPNAEQILTDCVARSITTWVWSVDGKVGALWGLILPSPLSERAYLWLLTSSFVNEHVFLFVRYSQKLIAEMLETYEVLVGHCEVTNSRAIRWLQWLGAEFGRSDGKLIPFQISRKHG